MRCCNGCTYKGTANLSYPILCCSLLQAVGDALVPHLGRLSSSQLKLLTIYRDKALTQPPRLGAT